MLSFSKMHGAGNDFVVVDGRRLIQPFNAPDARRLADRRLGVGCDQVMLIESPRSVQALASVRIFNADGSSARQCGNGARCVVAWLARQQGLPAGSYLLDGPVGVIDAFIDVAGRVRVGLGQPEFDPAKVPFRAARAALSYAITASGESLQIAVVSIGNPHAVLEVSDVDRAPVAQLGAAIEAHADFPDRTNVGFAQVLARDRIRLRVYERGVGETLACGSGACAAVACLVRAGKLDQTVTVELPGGSLDVSWDGAGNIVLSGPVVFVFEGQISQ